MHEHRRCDYQRPPEIIHDYLRRAKLHLHDVGEGDDNGPGELGVDCRGVDLVLARVHPGACNFRDNETLWQSRPLVLEGNFVELRVSVKRCGDGNNCC